MKNIKPINIRLIKRVLIALLTLSPILILFLYLFAAFFKDGYIIFTDVTEGLKVGNLYQRYIFTYSDDIGEALAEKQRIPLFYFIYLIFKLSSLNDSYYVKIKFVVLFALTIISYFASLKILLSNKGKKFNKNFFLLASTIGAIYYVINYWAVNRLTHFFLFFTSATVPIAFSLLYTFLFSKDFNPKKLLILLVFLAISSATPHTILIIGLIFFAVILSFILFGNNPPLNKLKKLALVSAFPIFYVLINAYWILPFLAAKEKPDAVLSVDIVNLLSQNASLVNVLILKGYWWTELKNYIFKDNDIFRIIDVASSFFPVLIFTCVLVKFRKKRLSISMAVLFLFSLFLASKTRISTSFYNLLMFDSPLKSIGWTFREFDKFGILLSFLYALAISLFLYGMQHIKSKCSKVLLIGTTVFILLLNPALYFFKTTQKNYSPQRVPKDFSKVNKILEADTDEFNVVWYPGVPSPYWLKTRENRFVFTNLSSAKPAVSTRSDMIYYLNYIFSKNNIDKINIAKALDIIGAKYLIIRSDENPFEKNYLVEKLASKKDLKLLYSSKILDMYENKRFTGLSKAYIAQIKTNEGLKVLQNLNFDTGKFFINYTDLPSFEGNYPTSYIYKKDPALDTALNRFQSKFIYPADYIRYVMTGKADKWRKTSLKNKTHAESSLFLKNLNLEINQFDFDKMIATSYDGWQLADKKIKPQNPIRIVFSKHPNVSIKNGDINYSSRPNDFKYYWNIIRSDRFNVKNISALRISFKSLIDRELIPHFKITIYNNKGEEIGVKFIYADNYNNVDDIVKIPKDEGVYADFSIWTLSLADKNVGYSYKLKNFKIKDASENVEPIELHFKQEPNCFGECTIYARVLKSYRGGEIKLAIGDSEYKVDTEDFSTGNLTWLKVGSFYNTKRAIEFKISNIRGFNAVNAIVLLDENEVSILQNEARKIESERYKDFATKKKVSQPKIKKINPTKYEIFMNSTKTPVVIGFAKPYDKNWLFNGEKPFIVNGFINGWLTKKGNGKFIIEYKPQRYFYAGVIISVVTLLLALGAFVLISKRGKGK